MIIAITGGKGGTGKSSIATALANELSKRHKVQLVDCDVDCPNDHLILGIERKEIEKVYQMIPVLDESKCTKCGKCAQNCKSNAIVFVKDKFPLFFIEQCNGCGVCEKICPTGAISRGKKLTGYVKIGKDETSGLDLISGEIIPTQMEGVRVIRKARELSQEKEYDFTIIDTAAGTHCPVVAALEGVDFVLAVTEPTPLGVHDLNLILDLCKELKLKYEVVINKSTIGDKNLVLKILEEKKVNIFGELPYSRKIIEDYSRGKPIVHKNIEEMAKKLERLSL